MFYWDEANIRHVAEHGVTPSEAEQALNNNPVDLETQVVDGEERMLQVGSTDAGKVLMIVVTWQHELIRIVTAFPASPGFRQIYRRERGGCDGRRHN